eukprot:403350064
MKEAFTHEAQMKELNQRKELDEFKSQVYYELEQATDFLMIKDLYKKGYTKIEEWISKINSDIINISKQHTNQTSNELQGQYDNKIDIINKEFLILKTQIELMKDMRYQISQVSQKLDEKATYQNLRNLEYQMNDYVKIQTLKVVEQDIKEKVDQEVFNSLKDEFRLAQGNIQMLMKINKVHEETQHQMDHSLKDSLHQLEKKLTNVEYDFKKYSLDNNARLGNLRDQTTNFKKEVENRFNEDHYKLTLCATTSDLERIKQSLDRFSTVTEFNTLKNDVLPVIRSFKLDIDGFKESNEQIKEMIRRFDEVLSEKASKVSILEFEHQIEKEYVRKKYWDQLQDEIKTTIQHQQDVVVVMQKNVNNFEGQMGEKIEETVKKSLQKTMQNYERVLNAFQKFFDQEELQKILDNKANLDMIQNLNDAKASKLQVLQINQMIEQLLERIKQLSILQVETARTLIPQKNQGNGFEKTENLNSKISKREYLLKLTQLTAQWVDEFDMQKNDVDNIYQLQRMKTSQMSTRRRFSNDAMDQSPQNFTTSIQQIKKIYKQMAETYKQDLPINMQIFRKNSVNRNINTKNFGLRKNTYQLSETNDFNLREQALNINQSIEQNQKCNEIGIFGNRKSIQDNNRRSHFSSTLSMNNTSPNESKNDQQNRIIHTSVGNRNYHHIYVGDNQFNISNTGSGVASPHNISPSKISLRNGSSNTFIQQENANDPSNQKLTFNKSIRNNISPISNDKHYLQSQKLQNTLIDQDKMLLIKKQGRKLDINNLVGKFNSQDKGDRIRHRVFYQTPNKQKELFISNPNV